jgi:hypothetical protein
MSQTQAYENHQDGIFNTYGQPGSAKTRSERGTQLALAHPLDADLFTKHLSPSWYRTQRRRRLAEVAGVPVATLSGDRGIVEGDGGEGGDQGEHITPHK